MTSDPSRGQYDPNRGQYGPPPGQGQPPHGQGQPPQSQGQLPPPQQWAGPPPPQGYQYPDPQHQYPYSYPPPQQHDMHQQPLQPQHPDPFRLPMPAQMQYAPYPPQMDPYRQQQQAFQTPAPRQRTAIACRYCRRRKIRCSGYEGENGKCSNCVRFGQECLFTPVSSSAQAFVPAHVAFPQLRNQGGGVSPGGQPLQLYGAHGQPLPRDYGKPSGSEQPNYPPPPNSSPYGYPQYPPTSAPYDGRGPAGGPNEPPSERRETNNSAYAYPDPTGQNLAPVSPATSVSSYQTGPSQSYYPSAPPSQRRASPQSTHSFDNRASDSPRGSTAALPATSQGQPLPGRTPPPVSGAQRPAMSVAGMLGGPSGSSPGDASRSTHDNNMLNALDRRNRGSGDERK